MFGKCTHHQLPPSSLHVADLRLGRRGASPYKRQVGLATPNPRVLPAFTVHRSPLRTMCRGLLWGSHVKRSRPITPVCDEPPHMGTVPRPRPRPSFLPLNLSLSLVSCLSSLSVSVSPPLPTPCETGHQAGLDEEGGAAVPPHLLRRRSRCRGRVLGSVVPARDPQDTDAGRSVGRRAVGEKRVDLL